MAIAREDWRLSSCVLWLWMGSLVCLLPHAHEVECLCSARDSSALLAFKRNITSSAFSSWKPGSDCCSGWAGVACDATETHVVKFNFSGPLGPGGGDVLEKICNLDALQVFDIIISNASEFDVIQIPTCIWNLTEMTYVSIDTLGKVVIPGSALNQVCTLRNLVHLNIAFYFFPVVYFPDCLWEMTKLEYLDLHSATATKSFSSGICKLRNLTHLTARNDESDTQTPPVSIPSCIWTMTRLEYLKLSSFSLPGLISPNACTLPNLKYLALGNKYSYGDIPACVWNLTKLEHFEIFSRGGSPFTLSSDVCNLIKLSYLFMRSSSFARGYIPSCLWNNTALERVDIGSLGLPGSFSTQMCRMSNLQYLDISYNHFRGQLPACVWNMSLLEDLDLSGLDLSNMENPAAVSLPSLTKLFIHETNVHAALLRRIGNLSALQYLAASGNEITTGTLSDAVQNLFQLSTLIVDSNIITAIPAGLGNLQSLQTLQLSYNRIRTVVTTLTSRSAQFSQGDEIPSVLSNLTQLRFLDLSNNFIVDLSPSIFNLSHLFMLTLSNNFLENFLLPPSHLRNLTYLTLSNNPLQAISSGLCQLQQLQELDLAHISLSTLETGKVLNCMKNLSFLIALDFSSNNVSRDLSDVVFSNSTTLWILDLSNNNITGDLSIFSGAVSQLSYLNLSRNQLTGELPRLLLSNSTYSFVSLIVSRNQLTGSISGRHGMVWSPSLQVLDMSHNDFSGSLPSSLGNVQHLQLLDLTSNKLEGSLPADLGGCRWLQHLRLSNNHFSGHIPKSIGEIGQSLLSITMANNYLEGPIPSFLGKCGQLNVLDLSRNKLNGSLPSTLGNLSSSLRVLTVADNRLDGAFPAWIVNSNFTLLQVLDLSNNHFHGQLPADYSKLSGFINGTNDSNNDTLYEDGIQVIISGIAVQLTYFVTERTYFDVSTNRFLGHIPEKLGELLALRYVNLSGNNFTGSIPTKLSNLHELDTLDLSRNSLTGGVPSELHEIPQLAHFNVSDNFLTGPIPAGGQFDTFGNDSYQNNSNLCSASGVTLRRCQSTTQASPMEAPQPMHRHLSWRESWFSLDAFFVGFGSSFGVVASTFILSKSVRDLLYTPRRKVRYYYNKPYGAYVPRT